MRKEVEEQRFLKGGHGDIDVECKFAPEVYSRKEGEAYRTADVFIADQMDYLMKKKLKQ